MSKKPERFLLGIDEAGTGAWAGPFCVAGTVFPLDFDKAPLSEAATSLVWEVTAPEGSLRPYRDSKKLSAKKRAALRPRIELLAVAHDVVYVSPATIEKREQGPAWQDAIIEVIETLLDEVGNKGVGHSRVDIMIDGKLNHHLTNRIHNEVEPDLQVDHRPKGDEAFLAVCAASILAKTGRDDYMHDLHERLPEYKFNTNVGYGTEEHAHALVCHGRTKFHRPLTKKWDLADR